LMFSLAIQLYVRPYESDQSNNMETLGKDKYKCSYINK
jgi:hypothetical protein